jgi:long-chain fatty aldehyde decarbonylase
MPELAVPLELDFTSETYKSAYSRINAIVIEGEYEANSNYIQLADILTDNKEELHRLAKMENRHMKGFQACGQNLQITPDMDYAREFFSSLHDNFQIAYAEGKVVTCLLIQSLIIEAFAIAAYNIYIPVADPFALEDVQPQALLHNNLAAAAGDSFARFIDADIQLSAQSQSAAADGAPADSFENIFVNEGNEVLTQPRPADSAVLHSNPDSAARGGSA